MLEKKLEEKNITYTLVTNVDEMIQKGFMAAPVLEVGGAVMDFSAAVNWINEMGENR